MKELWEKKKLEAEQSRLATEARATEEILPTFQREEVCEEENSRPIKQQSRAIKARWAGEQASEEDLSKFFLTYPLEKALALLGKMRKNCETAGKILNDRINQPEIQKCLTCGITWEDFIKTSRKADWFLNRPHYHPEDRNMILVDHFCSASCVSYNNNKTQGVRGISDRGMLPSDNPKFHPNVRT